MPEYPGLGLPLRHNPQEDYGHYPIGAHGSCYGSDSEMLPIRELAMMSIMDRLTDKEAWEEKVYDENIIARWREEAMAISDEDFSKIASRDKAQHWNEDGSLVVRDDWSAQHVGKLNGIMTSNIFDYCIKELRNKAEYYKTSKLIPTLDACASVVKSDKLVPLNLHDALRKAFEALKEEQNAAPDYHPNTKERVQDLVHPSMYPLVYGRSRVLKDEVVGVHDAIEKWAGKGEVIEQDGWTPDAQRDRYRYGVGFGAVPPQYWSGTYQWLPANIAFQEDGSVEFTSYINNLHPTKYPEIYRTIEQLIETALPAWDQCLAVASGYHTKDGAGRTTPRIPYPENPDDGNPENWIPSDPAELADVEVNWAEIEFDEEYDDRETKKWEHLRKPAIPGVEFEQIDYTPEPGKRLVERYAEAGLQVIVKMATIELTPQKPEFPVGGWHIEGQMNEHICATALYYLDSENVSSSELSFRMQTSAYLQNDIKVGQDCYHWMEAIYGTGLGGGNSPCLQNYGSVETRQGRLLAFPNVFQHRVSSFRLEDPTKPGHRRFIALWLIDPTQRIISTANVPPQRLDWWLDSAFGSTPEARDAALSKLPAEVVSLVKSKGLGAQMPITNEGSLPPEMMAMVRKYFDADKDALPMTLDEAKEHRLKLMEARGAFVKTAEAGWQQHSYSFCEH